jgi:sugar phosphate isomerase/epimerase
MHRLGIELLSVFSMPPVDHVALAADLGCDCISLGLTSTDYNPHGYAPFSLRDNLALRRETKAAMRDRGIAISLGEGCLIRPGVGAKDMAADMDILAELGCERINTLSIDRDPARTLDEFALFAEMVAERGMVSTIELVPTLSIGSLDKALATLAHVGRPDFRLLLDTMHLRRLRITPEQIAAIDPTLIDYVQLCDASDSLTDKDYMYAAVQERMVPGEGDVPLSDYIAVLPPNVTYALEVPLSAQAEAGVGPHVRVGRCVEAARRLLGDA